MNPSFRGCILSLLFCFLSNSGLAALVSPSLPNRTVFAIKCLPENSVWIGPEAGAAHFDGRAWTVYRPEDGLPHKVITSIALDPQDQSLWFGTFGGVVRYREGKFEAFTVQNSGLVNNVVYGVTGARPYVWIATTNGLSRYSLESGQWKTFNDENSPMVEVWGYAATTDSFTGDPWFAIWGSGVLHAKKDGETFDSYQDPDEIFDVDVVRNDGILHEIQATISARNGIIYSGSYFGLTRFDGKSWNTWTVKDPDSGLPSDFINVVKISPDGSLCAIGTDKGLCLFNFEKNRWVTYRKSPGGAGGELRIFDQGMWRSEALAQAPAGDFIWSVDFLGDTMWVGTSSGLYTCRIIR